MSVEECEEEIAKLHMKLSKMEAATPSVVYTRSDRKFPKFAGRPVKSSDPDVDEWITDMREHIRASLSKDGHADFVMDHLIGNAKSEVRLRPVVERETGEQILDILERVFITKDTVTQLQQKFYQRDQRDYETLEEYSLALLQLAEKVNRKSPKENPVNDRILIDRFIDGLKDQHLRQELRKFAIEQQTIPFLEFRHQILCWIEDNPPLEKTVRKASVTPDNAELIDMIKKQQAILEKQQVQIDKLTTLVSSRGYSPTGVPEVTSARNRFDATLQLLVDKKDDGHLSSDDGGLHGDTLQSDPSPMQSPSKRTFISKRKRKRKDDTDMELGMYHHTYVMKLFDRSVDLAQFDEDTPLYPICRAWLRNQPHNRSLGPRPRTPTPEPEPQITNSEEEAEEIPNVYKMPLPIKQDPDDHTDYRIPHPVPQPDTPFFMSDADDAPPAEDLLLSHMERWKQVRQSWIDQGRINEMRYSESMQLLREIFENQMKDM